MIKTLSGRAIRLQLQVRLMKFPPLEEDSHTSTTKSPTASSLIAKSKLDSSLVDSLLPAQENWRKILETLKAILDALDVALRDTVIVFQALPAKETAEITSNGVPIDIIHDMPTGAELTAHTQSFVDAKVETTNVKVCYVPNPPCTPLLMQFLATFGRYNCNLSTPANTPRRT